MWPILYQIPNTAIRLSSFGTMMVVALWASLWLASWRAKREKLDPDLIADMAFWVIILGLIGARLTYVVGEWGHEGMTTLGDAVAIWRGGIVLYGSILGGMVGFLLYRFLRPFPVLPTIDAIAPALAIGIAFGRIGCFFNGCCYGDRCRLPWSIRFPAKSIPWSDHIHNGWIPETAAWSLPVHPTQLYSALDGFLLVLLLSAYYPLRRRDGEVMALLMVTLPITRFLIEVLRDDDSVVFAGMTIAQVISVVVFFAGLGFWGWLRSRGPAPRYADTVQEPAMAVA
jgi:phosphatidylglycerol:prolipoprotein diacylglycerol transferase